MSDFNYLDPFQSFTVPLGSWVDAALTYLVHHFREVFRSIRWPVDQVLDGIQWSLLSVPPTEPPRVSRRPFCLSHATWADSVSC